MKEINGMKRGVKLKPQPTSAERVRQMDVDLKNMQIAGRMNQMMIQQMLQNFQNLSKDLGKAYGIINELQYKILAMQEVGDFDMSALNAKAEKLRLQDFEDASSAEDAREQFTVGDVVQENSTVIITSTTAGEDAGIFRSRIKLAECAVPALIEGLMGKSVGTKVTCQLNGVEHTVELLGIRNPPQSTSVEQTDIPATTVATDTMVH